MRYKLCNKKISYRIMKTVLLTVKIISERVKNISEIMDAAAK